MKCLYKPANGDTDHPMPNDSDAQMFRKIMEDLADKYEA